MSPARSPRPPGRCSSWPSARSCSPRRCSSGAGAGDAERRRYSSAAAESGDASPLPGDAVLLAPHKRWRPMDAPIAQLQWAVTVGAAVIVTSGALGDVLGRRKVFLAGLALFIASCALIALSTRAAGVVGGRMIQGASGATILACGMSLLSVASSGPSQMRAVTLWGAASAAGGALGPLVGGVLVETTGWQGLFWIDAAIAAVCVPVTLRTVQESRDPTRSRSIDWTGTVLVALVLAPVVLALSEGNDWGWTSPATLGCLAISVVATLLFLHVERRAAAPLVDLRLLRNRVLVGSTLAILIVAGTINALMYVVSLYFQDPAALGMSALEA